MVPFNQIIHPLTAGYVAFNPGLPSDFASYSNQAISFLMGDIINNAQKSYVRVHAFNVLASNNWNNNEFATAVSFIGPLFNWIRVTGQANDPQEGLLKAVQLTSICTASLLALNNNQLLAVLDQNTVNALQQNVNQLQQARQNGYMSQNTMVQNAVPTSNQMYAPTITIGSSGFGGVGVMSNNSYNTDVLTPNTGGRFDNYNPVEYKEPVVEHKVVEQEIPPTVSTFKASKTNPYATLADFNKFSVTYRYNTKSGYTPIIEEKESMERSKHQLNFTMYKGNKSPMGRVVELDINTLALAKDNKSEENLFINEKDEKENFIHGKYPNLFMDISLENALTIFNKWGNINKHHVVYGEIFIAKPWFYPLGDVNDIKKFLDQSNFRNAVELANAINEEINNNNSYSIVKAYLQDLNQWLTRKIIYFIRTILGESSWSIDNFATDYEELIMTLREDYPLFFEALCIYEQKLINVIYEQIKEEELRIFHDILDLTKEEDICKVWFHSSNMEVILVDAYETDVGFSIEHEYDTLVIKDNYHEFFRWVKEIFSTAVDNNVCLVVFRSGNKYEVSRGLGNSIVVNKFIE